MSFYNKISSIDKPIERVLKNCVLKNGLVDQINCSGQ